MMKDIMKKLEKYIDTAPPKVIVNKEYYDIAIKYWGRAWCEKNLLKDMKVI